jgi:hypothetical protein
MNRFLRMKAIGYVQITEMSFSVQPASDLWNASSKRSGGKNWARVFRSVPSARIEAMAMPQPGLVKAPIRKYILGVHRRRGKK